MDTTQLLFSTALSLVTGYIGGSLSESRRRRLERNTMISALSIEITNIAEKCNTARVRVEDFITNHAADEQLPRSNLSSNDWAIYTANITKLGLIDFLYVSNVVDFYARCRSIVDEETFIRGNSDIIPERLARHAEKWGELSAYGQYIWIKLSKTWFDDSIDAVKFLLRVKSKQTYPWNDAYKEYRVEALEDKKKKSRSVPPQNP
jgi:hypothetical protein